MPELIHRKLRRITIQQLEQTVQKLSELLNCDAPQFSMDQLRQKYNATSYSDSLEELQARFIEDMRTMYQKALEKIEACRENM